MHSQIAKRATGLQKQKLLKDFIKVRNFTDAVLVVLPLPPEQSPRKLNFQRPLRKPKKASYLCTPLRTEAGNELNSETRKNKNFHFSLADSKLLLTFALPIARQGFEKKKNRLVTATRSPQLEVTHVL
ncbi:hypothetical protein [Hymenobacter negativus]|uniref:hypothetical protein n=1 Tax=Hymenobacter negativus TaxID=2795026 RepID=UPI001AAE2BA8|nr:hypothetical protein [Hymenobacter negativus]